MKKARSLLFMLLAVFWSSAAFAGPLLHVHDSRGVLGTVDVENGDVNIIGNLGVVLTDIAFDPMGNLFGISFGNLYSVNANTAATTLIGAHGIAGGNALVFGTDGTLYGAGNTSTSIFSINTATGAATSLGVTGFRSSGDLAFNSGNLFLSSTTNQLVQIDLGNPANSMAVGPFGVGNVFGLATDNTETLFAVAGTTLYEVDTATGGVMNPISFAGQGLGTAFGESFFFESGAMPPPTPGPGPVGVPEPGTLGLLALGLVGLGIRRRIA